MADKIERVRFIGGTGFELAGILHRPQARIFGNILMAHCFTCSKNMRITAYLARALSEAGYAVLRFDFTGLGDSKGDFADTTLASDIQDLLAAAAFMSDQGLAPQALIGHSLGAITAMFGADQIPSAQAVVMLGSPADPEHLKTVFSPLLLQRIDATGRGEITIDGKDYPITREYLAELEKFDAPAQIANLNRPLLIVHGTADELVPISEAEKIFAQAAQPKFFVPIIQGNHLFSGANDFQFAFQAIRGFLEQALQKPNAL